MAEAFVPLLEKLADVALKELQEQITLVVDVKDKVNDLSINLNAIKKMLRDVEMKKMKGEDQAVEVWLEKLQDLAYEMDDVLDHWITENSKLETEASRSSENKWEKVRSFFLPICFCAKKVFIRHDIAVKIQELTGKVDHILTGAKKFEFTTTDHRDSSKSEEKYKRPLAISILNESEVCGRESDVSTIISKLLPQNNSSSNMVGDHIPVVSVVGVGGIGKTTLAKKVFNDLQVKEHFDHIIWVTVSNPFKEKRIARAILHGLGTDDAVDEPEALFNRIRESLENKKFLLILDDVWTEDYTKWTPFRDTLKVGAPESRILVTTRNEGVAIMLGSSYTHPLSPLKDNDSWLILSRNAFSQGSKALPLREKVGGVGWKIALKCQGLPLAALFMGNLLKFKYTVQQWEEILGSEIWKLKKASEGIFAHLYLSYNDLDPEMKRCFSYCAVFPKGSRIDVEQLIRIWIAQGFLSSGGNPEQLGSRGRECFDTLAMRSFFQDFERDTDDENKITTCKIHDIVHDFATFLTNKECCVVQEVGVPGMALCSDKVRHLSLVLMLSRDEVNFSITDYQKLRSIFCSRYVPPNLFTSLNSIRALILHDCGLQELPKEVGKFILLRYMDLSDNPLTELPEAISNLYNLETLDIKSCRSLIQLPSRIGKLVKLRCLINYQTESLRQFPQGFEKLTSLQTLSEFKVGRGYNKLGCLKSLNQLVGSLEIVIVLSGDASDAVYVENGELTNKENIRKLTLKFSNPSMNANVIEGLQLPPNLENLILQGYGGTNFPSWMVTSLNILRALDIRSSNVTSLPALGNLPSLEILSIYGSGLKVLGRDFLGITESSSSAPVVFRSLKKLSFECLEDWETWEDLREEEENSIQVMPCLTELNLYKCNRLKALPHRILRNASSSNSFTLSLKVCFLLLLRYSKLLGDDWKEFSHIPNVVKDFD